MPNNRGSAATTKERDPSEISKGSMGLKFHGVRYQVKDVGRSAAFYSRHLGFRVAQQHLPAFATLALGPLDMLLSGPEASGSRPMPDGRVQEAGGCADRDRIRHTTDLEDH